MIFKVAYKEYFNTLKTINIEASDYDDLDTQFKKLLNTEKVDSLELLTLPENVFVLLDKRDDREPNALGLRSNLIFIRESEDGNDFIDIEEEDVKFIELLMSHEPFIIHFNTIGENYYKNRRENGFKDNNIYQG